MTLEVIMRGFSKHEDPIKGARVLEQQINQVIQELQAAGRFITYMKLWADDDGNPRYLYVAHKKEKYNPYQGYDKRVEAY